uniref:hypothetical protein n=1 Tax=Candidatus Cryptobacteroides bacterium TaxID=3085639 RepID=UPI0040250F66
MKANHIIARIGNNYGFKQGKEYDGSSYLSLGSVTIRISNHKTHLWTWNYNFGVDLPKNMISIVFEDEPTISQPILRYPVDKSFTVTEYTYQSSKLNLNDIDKIASEINSCVTNYTCPLGIAKPVLIHSKNPI